MARKNLIPVLLALVLGAGVLWLDQARRGWGLRLARTSYDFLQGLAPGIPNRLQESPVLLIYLDVESHLALKQDPAARWDRALHTALLQRLTQAGARTVVFDVVFDKPWPDPKVDRAFAAAMRAHGRVVLAAERHQSDQSTGDLPGLGVWALQYPTPVLRGAAAAVGAAELEVDEDFVVRHALERLPEQDTPTLARAAAEVSGQLPGGGGEARPWLRYYGRPFGLPHLSYRSVLEPGALDDAVFRDRVVFVGARPMAGVFQARRDETRHPLSLWNRAAFMPGVEVHATQFLNLVRRDGLRRMAPGAERSLLVAMAMGLSVALLRLRVGPGGLVALGVIVGTTLLAGWLGQTRGIWFAWLIVPAVVVPVAWGVAIVHHGLDWHRQRRALEAQREADQRKIARQAALIDKAQDVIVVTDLNGRVSYANPVGSRLLGASVVAGNGAVIPVPDFAEKKSALLAAGEWSGSFEQPDATGLPRSIEARWTLIRDGGSQPEAILMIASDVTERRRLESEFLRAQKWEAVGSLAGGMAHDLNNRLAPALLGLQWLQKATLDDETRRLLTIIESHTRQGAETVRQVLLFLRNGSVSMAELDPAALVRELEALVKETFPKTIRVVSLVAPRVGRIKGNATQLQQALLNLCLNARDAMPDGGQLTFAVDDVDLDEAEARGLREGRPGKYVLIAISDSGSGIAPEHLAKIFDPLFTTKAAGAGTGLGLPSVLRTVEQHGGCLGVTSEAGAGSTFELYLPRVFAFDPKTEGPTG